MASAPSAGGIFPPDAQDAGRFAGTSLALVDSRHLNRHFNPLRKSGTAMQHGEHHTSSMTAISAASPRLRRGSRTTLQ